MPVGALVRDQFSPDVLKRLTRTTRPFYQKSLTLVNTCRDLPQPPQDAREQITARNALFKGVEDVLVYGTRTPPDKELKDADKKFEEQYKAINAYINRYLGLDSKTKPLDWEEVAKKDEVAGRWIKQVKADVLVKLESLKSIPTLILNVCLWPEVPRMWCGQSWEYASSSVDFKIEEGATLDVLLHQVFESKSLLIKSGQTAGWEKSISLKNNPQFYRKFPNKLTDYIRCSASNSEPSYIPALAGWDYVKNVKKYKVLHLIVDREPLKRKIMLENHSTIDLPQSCSNGWHLDDANTIVVVRLNASFSSALATWNTKEQFVPLFSPSTSTSTLVGSANMNSCLNLDDLDSQYRPSEGNVQDESKKPAAPSARVLAPAPSSPNISPYPSGSPPQTPARSSSPLAVAPPQPSPKPPHNNPPKSAKTIKIPPQFSSYFVPRFFGMNMVESAPTEDPGGLSGWLKRKLQNVVESP